MFDQITQGLSRLASRLSGSRHLTEAHIKDALTEIRNAMIEADVAVEVAEQFVSDLRDKAVGMKVEPPLTHGQVLINLVRDELINLMGQSAPINLRVKPPAVILLVGLQGAGKTTTAAKLAYHLKESKNKVAMVSCDVYRPAAAEQIAVLAKQVDCTCYPTGDDVIATAYSALEQSQRAYRDVLIVDTAGRLHVDQEMMDEARMIHEAITPVETLFVLDSMSGQDALVSARAFSQALPLTGIVMTKTDGDARGGSALSARSVVGKPIKFIGVGEKMDALQVFHPDRIASRILGMGEMKTLLEQYDKVADHTQSKKLVRKLSSGGFDLNDLKDQLQQIRKMGGLTSLVDKLPGMAGQSAMVNSTASEVQMRKMLAVIDSMTATERVRPNIVNGSRKRRIASGSGTHIQDVNKVLKQHQQMQKMLRKGGKLKQMMGMAKGSPLDFMK